MRELSTACDKFAFPDKDTFWPAFGSTFIHFRRDETSEKSTNETSQQPVKGASQQPTKRGARNQAKMDRRKCANEGGDE
jgi:hypothetical protein